MNILHITSWYPDIEKKTKEALFIKEHFDACVAFSNSYIWHVNVSSIEKKIKIRYGRYSKNEYFFIVNFPFDIWRIKEYIIYFLLSFLRIKNNNLKWDIVNVHIAYPLLRFPKIFKWLFGNNVVITEHWSAYKYNFYLHEDSKAASRIKKIFHHEIPVIAVSKSLMDNIGIFSGRNDFKKFIIPNIVNTSLFHYSDNAVQDKNYLMAACWSTIKKPILVMEAFIEIVSMYPDAVLRIIGYGAQWESMKKFVKQKNLEKNIVMLGAMDKKEIAIEMRSSDAFLHASSYETFSVVCAEALCCGTPVIASNVGGIPEFVNKNNGILVKDNTKYSWVNALKIFIDNKNFFDRRNIAKNAASKFNQDAVGCQLEEVYRSMI